MDESKSNDDRPQHQRRFSQEQYDILKRCSERKDITEWNEWRKQHPDQKIALEGAKFRETFLRGAHLGWAYLKRANFTGADLGRTELTGSHLESAQFTHAYMEEASLSRAHLTNARFEQARLEKANFEEARLEGADFAVAHLKEAYFNGAHMEGVSFFVADLEGARLPKAHLQDAILWGADLRKANFEQANLETANLRFARLEGTNFRMAVVNGYTLLCGCNVDRDTDFRGVGLDSARIDSGTKQLLQYNIRRMNWEEWYWDGEVHILIKHIIAADGSFRRDWRTVRRLPMTFPVRIFWWMSDYGRSTGRIIASFFILAVLFATIFYLWGLIEPPGILDYLFVDGNGVEVAWWLVPIRAIHFSVVVMTVGFTNMHANAHSFWAHILVSMQMILGFVLLGALVTRFAVLFTAGGPAGKFADEKKEKATESTERHRENRYNLEENLCVLCGR